jgi:hypothetical protein
VSVVLGLFSNTSTFISGTSSVAVIAVKKWEPAPIEGEVWTAQDPTVKSWSAISTTGETWTVQNPTGKTWAPVSAINETWTPRAFPESLEAA